MNERKTLVTGHFSTFRPRGDPRSSGLPCLQQRILRTQTTPAVAWASSSPLRGVWPSISNGEAPSETIIRILLPFQDCVHYLLFQCLMVSVFPYPMRFRCIPWKDSITLLNCPNNEQLVTGLNFLLRYVGVRPCRDGTKFPYVSTFIVVKNEKKTTICMFHICFASPQYIIKTG